MSILDSLKDAYNNSIHTIMTSGSILIIVTLLLGLFSKAEISLQVCLTISVGSLIAISLILLILPGMLAVFDKLIKTKK